MSPRDKETIDDKLFRLQEVTRALDGCRQKPKEVFLADAIINGAAMFNLAIGIGFIVDIGQFILNKHFQTTARSYAEVIEELGKRGVIDQQFAEDNSDMARFRNRLIHDYDKIDLNKVYDYLQKAPDVFRAFAAAYVEFLEKNK